MLIDATKAHIEAYQDRWYALAQDPARSSYPLFSDGLKTRQDFLAHLTSDGETRLCYMEGGDILGLIQFFTIPADRYLQLTGWYILRHAATAMDELLAYLAAHYAGYELYFGFSDQNREMATLLTARGFALIEDDCHDVLQFSAYQPQPDDVHIRRIDADSFGDFRRLHPTDASMYWNSDRIFASLDQWNIYAYDEAGMAVAAIFETDGEIFGMDFQDGVYRAEVFRALVIRVLNELKAKGCRDMTFMNEDATHPVVMGLGFRAVGRYQLFHRVLG